MKQRLTMILVSLFCFVGMAMAQVEANGLVVSSDDGSPVVGATVKAVGSSKGVITDVDGRFAISVPSKNSMLEFSYVGMETKTVKAAQNMRVTLEPDEALLDEVMVIGYGTSKRSAFTGAAAEVKSSDISKHVSSTATSAVVGKMAGVTATSSSGAPGSAPVIRVRGIGSMSASSAPLYIVDGAPLDGAIADINPGDIESISVLKDASASAIYGARGGNGVVIITTKQAKAGREPEIKVDAKWGSNSRLVPNYDVITSPEEYYEQVYKGLWGSKYYHGSTAEAAHDFANANLLDRNNGGVGYQVFTVPEGQRLVGTNFKFNPNATAGYSDGEYYYQPDNWYDEAFHNSFRQEYNASVSGASGRLTYYAGLGYLDDGGMVNNSQYQRYNARTNVTYQVRDWFKFTSNMNYTHTDSKNPATSTQYGSSGNIFYIANSMGPIYPLYVRDTDGNIMQKNGLNVYDRNQTNQKRPSIVGNALGDNEIDLKNTARDYILGKWQADIMPFKGMTLSAALTAQNLNSRYNALYSPFGSSSAYDGIVYVESDRYFSTNQLYTANYQTTIAEKHNINVIAGYEQYNLKEQAISGENSHLFDPFIAELDNALGKADMSVSSATGTYMTEGFLARASYDYDERYFFSASIRREASSRFAPGHRWGTFGSVGAAWQINKEAFLADAKWINLLKFKASWGSNGNDDLYTGTAFPSNNYMWADRYSSSYNEDTGEYSLTLVQKGNEDLTWEKIKSWNTGFDFSFFNYRLNGSIDFYRRTTDDMLYSRRIPLSSGLPVSSYRLNIGNMYNQGLELTLEYVPVKTKNIEWSINLNATTNKNRITALDSTIPPEGLTYSDQIIRVGGTIYDAYLLKYAGVEKETGKALYYKKVMEDVVDANGNKVVDENGKVEQKWTGETETTTKYEDADQFDCGSTLADLTGGFGTALSLYGFDISAQFTYSLGGKIYDGSYQRTMGYAPGSNMHKDLRNCWTEDNKDANLPRWSSSATDDGLLVGPQTPIDYFLTSSNYLCMSNLTVGYTVPKNILRNLDIKGLRVYFSGENLFLLTARKGLDPRFNYGIGSMTSGAGMISDAYSAGRSVTAGITVTF
ncbi:MAG: TonB-dependent receptor [Bacteroidaceae bacterium]|nr:TonB-dependent receptor [Bacteroidaceae bacterium]